MDARVVWNREMEFSAEADGHRVLLDAKAPIGKNAGFTPKELVALAMAGCTAMDVIALLKKYKMLPTSFDTRIEVQSRSGSLPAVFESAEIIFSVVGEVDPGKLLEATHLSQTKYCSVNAMLSKALPISYRVELNGTEIGRGEARF